MKDNSLPAAIKLITAACIGMYLQGCMAIVQFGVSVPQGIPAGVKGDIRDDFVRLVLPGLNLEVQVQNYQDSGAGLGPDPHPSLIPGSQERWAPYGPLRIWLAVEPAEEGFSFDPGRVLIKYGDGTSVKPSAFIGPATIWGSARDVSLGCGARRYGFGVALSRMEPQREGVKAPQGPVPFSGKRCFVLWFDTDASPARDFALLIDGIEKSGRPIPIPEVRYKSGSVWKHLIT